MTFLRRNNNLKAKLVFWKNNSEKMDFSWFLVLKTGKLSYFTLDKFFVSQILANFHKVFMKLQV
jgi:hypothetical protein